MTKHAFTGLLAQALAAFERREDEEVRGDTPAGRRPKAQ
jgi:hypothetical protein